MTSNGIVKYEMRLVFNRCHGENPKSCGAAEAEESGEFVELEDFIYESGGIRTKLAVTRAKT
jgi:hypothetical protein